MFKKVEIWIVYLIILFGIPIIIGFGFLVRHELLGGKKFGPVSKTALFLAEIPSTLNRIKGFQSTLQVKEDRFSSIKNFNGTPNFNESYLLLSRYDGNKKEGIVELVDLTNFKVLHTWNPDIDEFNKSIEKVNEFKYINRDMNNARMLIEHPKLTKDGGLLFISSILRKIDACSNLISQITYDIFHHSIETDIEGNIWVPSQIYPQSLPINKVGRDATGKRVFRDDAIVKISPEGEVLFEKSVSQIFIDNDLEYLLFSHGDNKFTKDPIHLNDIQPVDFDGEFWNKGDVFLSLRNQSMILLYRPSTNEIIWKGTGPFFHQHDVDILNGYSISVFNNNSKNFVDGHVVDGHNQILLYDFKKNEYSTYLSESLIRNDVRAITNGRSQILSNGDLYIEESRYGRLLFYNADSSLRWKYLNRADNGNLYFLGWSRILYNDEDINIVNNFMSLKDYCNY